MIVPCAKCGEPTESRIRGRKHCQSCLNKSRAAKCKRWRKANPERDAETSKRYRSKHMEHLRYKSRRWREANPDLNKIQQYRLSDREAGRLGCDEDLDLDIVRFRDNIRCQPCSYCGEGAGTNGADRLDESLPHHKSNIVPSCSRCNFMKGGRLHLSPSAFVEACRKVVEYAEQKASEALNRSQCEHPIRLEAIGGAKE